jgi:hypothetical protein
MAAKKKSAIEARQGHPAGILDDAGKAIGKAVKKTRSAGEFVSDVASDRKARLIYSTVPKKLDDMALNRRVKKMYPRKKEVDKSTRNLQRAVGKEMLRENTRPFAVRLEKKLDKKINKKYGQKGNK